MSHDIKRESVYGLLAEFETPEEILAATEHTYQAGYRDIDAYTPIPVEGLADALGFHRNFVAPVVFVGGVLGGLAGFGMCWYANVISYPWNIGGRPHNSWPAFIPITFELTILGASLAAVFGMIAMNGLPLPYHPVFNVERFARASQDRFFLCVFAKDKQFDAAKTKAFLESLHAHGVFEIEA